MKFGIFPCTQDPPRAERIDRLFDEIVAEAQEAERAGFDSCLITEHHQMVDGYFPSPLIASTAIAAKTTRLRVGSGILLLGLYHPVRVAEDGAMLDIVSKGRLILGVGAGYGAMDFEAFGIPISERPSRFEEGIQVVKRAWTEERFSFFGKRYQLKTVSVTPKPIQKPHPPIWVGGWTDEGIKRAARLGDAWFMDVINNMQTLGQWAALYRKTCEQWGKRPYIAALREAWVAETTEQAEREYGPYVMDSHLFYYRLGGYNPQAEPWMATVTSEADFTLDKVKKDRFIMGSPQECIRQIEQWRKETGVDYLVLRFRHPSGPAHEKVRQAVRLFGEKVIPHFA